MSRIIRNPLFLRRAPTSKASTPKRRPGLWSLASLSSIFWALFGFYLGLIWALSGAHLVLLLALLRPYLSLCGPYLGPFSAYWVPIWALFGLYSGLIWALFGAYVGPIGCFGILGGLLLREASHPAHELSIT